MQTLTPIPMINPVMMDQDHHHYYETEELRNRGWFDSAIDAFLPRFDAICASTLSALYPPKTYYRKSRIQEIECSPDFMAYQQGILDKAAQNLLRIGKAHQPLIEHVRALNIDRELLPHRELSLRANAQINTRSLAAAKSEFGKNLGDILLPVIFVQVQMDQFEPQLWQLEPYFFHPSYHRATEILTHRFLDAILNEYPEYLVGCEHYAAQRYYNFNQNGWDCQE